MICRVCWRGQSPLSSGVRGGRQGTAKTLDSTLVCFTFRSFWSDSVRVSGICCLFRTSLFFAVSRHCCSKSRGPWVKSEWCTCMYIHVHVRGTLSFLSVHIIICFKIMENICFCWFGAIVCLKFCLILPNDLCGFFLHMLSKNTLVSRDVQDCFRSVLCSPRLSS